jgi:UDP-2,4-diacetamido-2,4,6-trideoxy-beta-L-altropyranose hydrolase
MRIIAIRVDASVEIGLGHLLRCVSLAKALVEAGTQVMFVVRDHGLDYSQWLSSAEFGVIVLKAPEQATPSLSGYRKWLGVTANVDAQETAEALQSSLVEYLFVDSYAIDASWHESVRHILECKIVAIDDLGDRDLSVDFILDQNFEDSHSKKYEQRNLKSATILGGPRFALLGPDYCHAPRYVFSERVRSVGVFMGGTDSIGGSALVFDALDAIGFQGRVEIAVTSSNPALAVLKNRVSGSANYRLALDSKSLATFFAAHDLQIGACGSSTWERFCIGVPTVSVCCAENQLKTLKILDRENLVYAVETLDLRPLANAIASAIDDIPWRRTVTMRSKKVVDGLGAQRVARSILQATEMCCDN